MIDIPDTGKGTSVVRLTPARCNIFAVTRNGRTILVDTGISFDRSRIAHALERRGLIPEAVVLTHTHFDHAGNTAWLAAEYGAEIVVQEAESLFLAGGDTPIPEGTYAVTEGLVSIGRKVQPVFRYDPCVADHVFTDRFDLNRFGINGYVLHTPGHSPGGVALYCARAGLAVSGDALFAGSIGRTDFPGCDFATLERSIRTKLYGLPPQTVVYPGHGPKTTIQRERTSNPFVHD